MIKAIVTKRKDIRGRRIVGYTAKIGPIEADADSERDAVQACEKNAFEALERLDRGAIIHRWRERLIVIVPTCDGWAYWTDHARLGYWTGPRSSSREECEDAAFYHVAQNEWTAAVTDDEAFLDGLPLSIRDDLRSWIGFQRRFIALKEQGVSGLSMSCDSLSSIISHGFSAGNYANAYVSEDLESAWEEEMSDLEADDRALRAEDLDAYRAGFVVGFFGSYSDREVPCDHSDELTEAVEKYRALAAKCGIAWRDDDDEDNEGDEA